MKSQQKEQCKRELYGVPPNTPTEFMVQFFACLERKGLLNRPDPSDGVHNSENDKDVKKSCDAQVVDHQKLTKKRSESPDLHERLLREIRSSPKLRPTRDGKLVVGTCRPQLSMDSYQDPPSPAKKLIKPDFSLLFQNSFEESSGEEDVLKSASQTSSPVLDLSFASGTVTPPSPPWHRADAFLFDNKVHRPARLQRRHTIVVCETPSDRKKNWPNSIEYLSLTLEELTHIRSVFTKAELESLAWHPELYQQVSKSKLCFTCKTTRFTLFGEWGTRCKICQRTVCSKCIRKMNVPTDHFRNIPVYTLSPSLLTSEIQDFVQKTIRTAPAPSVPQTRASSPTRSHKETPQKQHKLTIPDSAGSAEYTPKELFSQSKHSDGIHTFPNKGLKKGPLVKHSIKGPMMVICFACGDMVTEIIRSSRTSLASLPSPNSSRQISTSNLCHMKAMSGSLARN